MNKEPIKLVAAAVVVIVAIGGAYYAGYESGLDQTKNIVIEHITSADASEDVTADFSIFWEAWDKLKTEHIRGGEVSNQDLVYGAIKGLAEAYGDPNTSFFTPEDSKKFSDDIQGSFGGIGAEIGSREGQIIIVAPLKDTPAEQAGLLSGDQILQIDGASTDGMTIEEAVKLIRGELGTTVTLTILRADEETSRKISIVRANIQIPTVEWTIVEGNMIHLRLYSFTANSVFDFQRHMINAVFSGGEGLILDLRGNPGGLLDSAIRVAGFFLERGDVVAIEKFTSGKEIILRSSGNAALKNFPVVVLIDGGSASASEILAGALRVQNGVKLVGQQSFGKGTVQELNDLSDDSILKITIANWLLPDGTLIEGNGLEPDFIVEITAEDIAEGRDPQLERAIEILKQSL